MSNLQALELRSIARGYVGRYTSRRRALLNRPMPITGAAVRSMSRDTYMYLRREV